MKPKIQKNASKIPILKVLFLLCFLSVEFFGFGLQGGYKAHATANICGFGINFNAASTVQLNQPLSFNVVINTSPNTSNIPLACMSKVATLVIWDAHASNTGGYTVPALTYCFITISNINSATYTLSNCAQSTQVIVSDQYYKAGYIFNLHAGVYAGQLDTPIYPSAVTFDTQSDSNGVNVTVAGGSGGSTCQTNPDCANQGVGYVCNSSKTCVAATDFSCSSGSSNCPSGLKCVGNQCLEPCSSNSSCDWQGETCDTKAGSSTLNYCTDATGAGPSTPPSTPPATTAATGPGGNPSTILINPIQKFNNLTDLLVNIMKAFLGIIAVWAVAFIVIGGFKMVISSGNEEAVLSARKTITWAVLGLLVAVLSFAIIAIVQNLIGVTVPATTPTSYNIQPVDKI